MCPLSVWCAVSLPGWRSGRASARIAVCASHQPSWSCSMRSSIFRLRFHDNFTLTIGGLAFLCLRQRILRANFYSTHTISASHILLLEYEDTKPGGLLQRNGQAKQEDHDSGQHPLNRQPTTRCSTEAHPDAQWASSFLPRILPAQSLRGRSHHCCLSGVRRSSCYI